MVILRYETMSLKKIRILNFDDSVIEQKALLGRYEMDVVDLRDLGPGARFWVDNRSIHEIERRISGKGEGCVTFLGSGDFHHVTELLLRRYSQPLSLIDFDFHHDWDATSPLLHCGSWVSRAMKRRNILKCIILGASSKEFSFFSLQAGDLAVLKDDRTEIYPYSSEPGAIFFRAVPSNISFRREERPFFTKILWNELKGRNITEFFLHIIKRLPSKKVYITIDKDCLNAEAAITNWDQGKMPLGDLLLMLKLIKDNCDIAGMDITGEYSPARLDGAFKNFVSSLNHPRDIKVAGHAKGSVTALNEATNLKILEIVTS